MVVWGGLINSCGKKSKRQRYTQLNAEFQRIAKRDKKALSEQCKGIEANNRKGKNRDLFKKTGGTENISCKEIVKDRNGKDSTEV